MFEKITIKNFKSIVDASIDLGRINVFVGANGVGKSNVLEAIAMLAANSNATIDLNKLSQAGVRVAKPDLMRNSFLGRKASKTIEIDIEGYGCVNEYRIIPKDEGYFMTPWQVDVTKKEQTQDIFDDALFVATLSAFEIYTPMLDALRGLSQTSLRYPLGLHGEEFDLILNMLPDEKKDEIANRLGECIDWVEQIAYDKDDVLKLQGLKLGRSKSHLFFRDRYMQRKMTLFSAENANEGALVLLFYLTLLMSDKTPGFFAIDNIDTGLNPRLCRYLMKLIADVATQNGKQLLVTTHNPAFLDGMNLNDDQQRLFVVSRSDEGTTKVTRVKTKPQLEEGKTRMKLSEMWMNGLLGGVPTNF